MGSTCCKDKEIAISPLPIIPPLPIQSPQSPQSPNFLLCFSCRQTFKQNHKHCSTCHVTWNDFTQYHICKWNKIYSVENMCCHHCGDEYGEGELHECDISRIKFEDVRISKDIEIQYKSVFWDILDNACIVCLDTKKCVSLKCCQGRQFICLDCMKDIEKKLEHLFICPVCSSIIPISEICEIEEIKSS